MSYRSFLQSNARVAFFGLLMAFGSNFGQTFFISLFNEAIQAEFSLSETQLGLYYSIATIGAGLLLIFAGGLVDRMSIRKLSFLVFICYACACIQFSLLNHIYLLILSFFLIRFTGQGLCGHIAMTSMSKLFFQNRGKALGFAVMGFPLGEALLPISAVTLLSLIGWRMTWVLIAVVIVVGFIPMMLWLLAGFKPPEDGQGSTNMSDVPSKTRKQMLCDVRFYLLLPAIIAPPMILTGMFFQQTNLAKEMGWSLTHIATAFTCFAVLHVIGALLSGPSIDKRGALIHLPCSVILLMISISSLLISNHPAIAYVYLGVSGFTTGVSRPMASALWAQMYGVAHFGEIKALITAIVVLSTAVAPVLFGYALDLGLTMTDIIIYECYYLIGALSLVGLMMLMKRPSSTS